jgi:hypothetical protein
VKNVFASNDPRSILLKNELKNEARNITVLPKKSDIRNEMPSLLAHVKVSERASNYNKVNTLEPDKSARHSFSKYLVCYILRYIYIYVVTATVVIIIMVYYLSPILLLLQPLLLLFF